MSLSSNMSTKFTTTLMTANMHAAAPNAAVPPSVRQARCLLTAKPQMNNAAPKSSERVVLHMLRMASPRSAAGVCEVEREVNVMADEARASGPRRRNIRRASSWDGYRRVRN